MNLDDRSVQAVMQYYRLIQNLRSREQECQYQIRELIREARKEGMTWAAIADALGTSTQAAWARYAHPEAAKVKYDQEQLPIED